MGEESQYTSGQVFAYLTIGGESIPISRVILNHSLDELPTAQVVVQLDNKNNQADGIQGAVNMNLEKFRQTCQVLQERAVNTFKVEPKDVLLKVVDANNHKIEMPGFLCRPEFSLQSGQVDLTIGVIHAMAVLQAWNGQIYNYVQPYVLPELIQAFGEKATAEAQQAYKENSVAMRMLALVEYAMNSFVAIGEQNASNQFDMMPIHLLNKRVVQYVQTVLRNSKQTTMIDGLKDPEFSATNLETKLFEILRNCPNFWFMLQEMRNMFMFQINADWEGHLWLERLQCVDEPATRRISVPIADVHFSSSHLYELPVLQVIVVSAYNELYGTGGAGQLGTFQGAVPNGPALMSGSQYYSGLVADKGETFDRLGCIARYPEDVPKDAVGNFFVLVAPTWVNDDALLDAEMALVAAEKDQQKAAFENVIKSDKLLQEAMLSHNKPRIKVLKYMAEQFFKSMYLGATVAVATVPLDLRPAVGRTYTVQDLNGKGLFIGFLRQISHTININPDGAAISMTTLMFSHIRVFGASLNAFKKVEVPADDSFVSQANVDTLYVDPEAVQGPPVPSGFASDNIYRGSGTLEKI